MPLRTTAIVSSLVILPFFAMLAEAQTVRELGSYDPETGPRRTVVGGLLDVLPDVGAIVHGQVTAVDYQWADQYYEYGWTVVETIVTLEVRSWLCGGAGPETVYLRFPGGRIPGRDLWMSFGRLEEFYVGEEFIFFLRRPSEEDLGVVPRGPLGYLRIVPDSAGDSFVVTADDRPIVVLGDTFLTLFALHGFQPSRPSHQLWEDSLEVASDYRYTDFDLLSAERATSRIEEACRSANPSLDYFATTASRIASPRQPGEEVQP
jgi:hypothetical protein